jgi:hypothetical protein
MFDRQRPEAVAEPSLAAVRTHHTPARPPRDFWASLAVLQRRWKLVVAGVVATVAAAAALFTLVPPSYVANGSMMLLPPASAAIAPAAEDPPATVGDEPNGSPEPGGDEEDEPAESNPYLGFGGTLNVMGEVLAHVVNSESVAAELAPDARYEVDIAPGIAPILTVEVSSPDPEVTHRSLLAVMDEVNAVLEERQAEAGAPASTRITSRELSVPEAATRQRGSKVRAAVAAAALGVAATIGLAFTAEGWSERRRLRSRPTEVA